MNTWISFLNAAIIQGVPLLYGATGEIITEKSGNLNLGIPGIMYVGGISGIIGGYLYEHGCKTAGITPAAELCILIPFLSCLAGSALMALIYSFLVVTLRANQNVTGLALTTFGVGVGNFFGGSLLGMFGESGSISLLITGNYYKACLPFAKDLGAVGKLFFSYGFLVYLAIVVAILAGIILSKTRIGLNLRAVGESPATADAVGINVSAYKYVATVVGGMIAGLGGLYFVMDYTGGAWTNNGFGDRGWLSIAIVIFALWKPVVGILCSLIFGGLYIACVYIPVPTSVIELIKMLPYLVTIIVLISVSIRKKRENQPPAALGLSYFREER